MYYSSTYLYWISKPLVWTLHECKWISVYDCWWWCWWCGWCCRWWCQPVMSSTRWHTMSKASAIVNSIPGPSPELVRRLTCTIDQWPKGAVIVNSFSGLNHRKEADGSNWPIDGSVLTPVTINCHRYLSANGQLEKSTSGLYLWFGSDIQRWRSQGVETDNG